MLPLWAKDHVKQKYEDYKPRLLKIIDESNFTEQRKQSSRKEAVGLLDQYVKYMYAKDFSEHLPRFWQATRKLDKIRNHSIETYIPELYELLKDTEFEN